MNAACASVNIHHKAESSVCTAAHPQKYFVIFDFILEARSPQTVAAANPPIYSVGTGGSFPGYQVAEFDSDGDALTHTHSMDTATFIFVLTLLFYQNTQVKSGNLQTKQCFGYWVQWTGKYFYSAF
jgi:hypothetical protein